MDDVYLYYVPLPPGINEMVTPCYDGFTIYIDESLDEEQRMKAYLHAMTHIQNKDHYIESSVDDIEAITHMKGELA